MTEILKRVEALCGAYGSRDPFALCEALRIGVLHCDLPEEVKGFYLKISGSQVVFLNEKLEETEARVTCGHELGHAVLHDNYNEVYLRTQTLLNCQRYENEADLFCAALLIGPGAASEEGGRVTIEDVARGAGLPLRMVELWCAAQREQGGQPVWNDTHGWMNI